jgi:hypothetical protein
MENRTATNNSFLRDNTAMEFDNGLWDRFPAVTVDEKRQIWTNQRQFQRDIARVPYIAKHIRPTENEWLVFFLLRFQWKLQKWLNTHGVSGFELRLRWLAEYAALLMLFVL